MAVEHIHTEIYCGDCVHFESIHPCFDCGQGGICQIAESEENTFVVAYDFACKNFIKRD